MADIEWCDVVEYDQSLSEVSNGTQLVILGHVNNYLDVSLFGGEDDDTVKLLRILLAAHIGTMALRGGSGATGPISSESTGGISRSYAVAMTSSGSLGSTTHGQTFTEIIRNSAARAPLCI